MPAATLRNPCARDLNGQDPMSVLRLTSIRLQSLTFNIGRARIDQSPAPGKWSPRDIFCHLADSEIVFAYRLRQTLAEDRHQIQPFAPEKWSLPYPRLDADEALAAFSRLRHWNLLLIESALPVQAQKPAVHPRGGLITFTNLVETMAGHDLNHLSQLEQLAAA